MKALLVGLVLLMLGGCAGKSTLSSAQQLYQLQGQYNAMGAAVLAYVNQPLCMDEIAVPCANVDVVWALQVVDREVYNVLLAAEAARHTADAQLYLRLVEAALARLRAGLVRYAITETLSALPGCRSLDTADELVVINGPCFDERSSQS